MPSPLQARRAEEKLGIILDRVGAIRVRVNSLAWQGAAFGALGWTIACLALVFLAAYYLAPLPFLGISVVLVAATLYGLVRTGRTVARTHSSMLRAAELADQRAGLKGRLETIVELGRSSKSPPAETASSMRNASVAPMWSYLIEDALAHQGDFEPGRIENRRLSRSIYGLLGALALALLVFPLIRSARRNARHPVSGQSEITLGLNDLKLQPADPNSNNGVEVHADARTMKMLEEMMAAQGLDHGKGSSNSLNRLLNRARGFADKLQGKLTGRTGNHPHINLKLADAGNNPSGLGHTPPPIVPEASPNNPPQSEPQNPSAQADSRLPPMEQSRSGPEDKTPDADKSQAGASQQGGPDNQEKASAGDRMHRGRGDHKGGAGSSHGSGADPDTLFGQRTEPRFGNQGFQIAIEARPMTNGPRTEGHPYVPPKVNTPLNPEQQPDEPIPRASVPEQDRAAIKSVFER